MKMERLRTKARMRAFRILRKKFRFCDYEKKKAPAEAGALVWCEKTLDTFRSLSYPGSQRA
jgi:hypothetical protein